MSIKKFSHMDRSRKLGALAAVALVPALLAGCGDDSDNDSTDEGTTQEQTQEETEEPTEDPTEETTSEEATDETTEETTEEPTSEEATDETTDEATDDVTEDATDGTDGGVDGDLTTLTDSEGTWSVDLPSEWIDIQSQVGSSMYTLAYGNTDSTQSVIIGNLGESALPPAEILKDQLATTLGDAPITIVDNPPSLDGQETIALEVDAPQFVATLLYVQIDGTVYEFTVNGATAADRDEALAYLDTATTN